MLENAENRNKLTHIDWDYYEKEAIGFLPSILNLLIENRVEDLQYNLVIYETHPTATKYENKILYTKFCLDTLHLSEENYHDLCNESKLDLIDNSYLISFLFYSKKVTEAIFKKLMEHGYKVTVQTEVLESGEEYKNIIISWGDKDLNS